MYLTPGNALYYSAAKVESRFLGVSSRDARAGSGTGFLVRRESGIYFVTNRHNVDYDYRKGERTGYSLQSLTISGWAEVQAGMLHRYEATLEGDLLRFLFTENDGEDVIVTPFSAEGTERICAFDFASLGQQGDFAQTYPGEPMLMYGYSQLMNAQTGAPVARSGIVASDPSHDYRHASEAAARRVAIEAMSTSGMSGSPVYVLQRGPAAGPGIKFDGYRRGYLLGINCAHYHEEDQKVGQVHGHMSACIKASVIAELIQLAETN